jgi:hypothetical protein
LSTDAVENTQPSNSPIDTQGLAGSLRGEADEIVVGGWLHPESFLLGTSQAMVLDTLPPTNPAGPQPSTEEPPLDDADIPDTVRRIVYVFNDRLTAARQDRPTGLVRCELTMRQLTALRQLRGGDADLLALLRPAIEELQQKSLDPLPTSASRDPRPADPSEAASVHQRLEALSDPSLFMGGEDLRLEEHLDYVPEVATFLLRYYDGQTWRSRWDSRVEGRLPVVVEIRFQLSAELKPLTSDHAEVQDEFDELLTAEENPLLSGESSTLEPIDERQQSAQARPPEDHRFLIFVRPVSSSDAVEADKAFGASSTVSSPQEGAIPSSPTPSSP